MCLLARQSVFHRIADETHAMAKRKLAQMAKLRDVFGFTIEQDSKEGESFDRELQEQRKRDRLMEKELREKTKVKEARARAKEVRHKQREEKRAIKKADKDRQKEEKAKLKVRNTACESSIPVVCLNCGSPW